MRDTRQCEYCNRPIKVGPVKKALRGKEHIFCSEFCFRLFFYDVPTITYARLQQMYELRCVSVQAPDFRTLIVAKD